MKYRDTILSKLDPTKFIYTLGRGKKKEKFLSFLLKFF